jgi:hypothetical protein
VTGGGSGGAGARWAAIMLGASASQSLFHARLDVAFGLAANSGQLRNHQVARPLEHPLFTKGKRLEMTEISQMFEHVRSFENIPGPHLLGEVFKTIFPIVRRKREIVRQRFKKQLAFT